MTKKQKLGLALGLGLALPSAIAIAVATPFLVKKYNNKSPQAKIEKLEKDLKKSALAPILQAEKDILRLKIEEIIKTNDLLSKHQVATLKSKEFQEALDEVIDANALKVSYIFKTLGLDESDVVSFYRTIYNDNEFKNLPKSYDILIDKFVNVFDFDFKANFKIFFDDYFLILSNEKSRKKIIEFLKNEYLIKFLKSNNLFELYKNSNFSLENQIRISDKILEIVNLELVTFITFTNNYFSWGGGFSFSEAEEDKNGNFTENSIKNSKLFVEDQKQEFDKNLGVTKTTKLGSKLIELILFKFKNYPNSYTKDKILNKNEDFEYYPIAKKINNYARKIFNVYENQNKKLDFEFKTETYINEISAKFIDYVNILLKLKSENKISELNSQKKQLKEKIFFFTNLNDFYEKDKNLEPKIKQLFDQKFKEIQNKIKELSLKLDD
ncbi:hypothetical protein [Metamycoplasma equirhinis]|uniref:hypothetical protein n=1 Tax=Metamycoplasma equirhinis TaxID=92402 RepID=UPI0035933062